MIEEIFNHVLKKPMEVRDFPSIRQEKLLANVLSISEVERIICATTNFKQKTILMTFYATGRRLEELRLFRLENMDSQRMTHKVMGMGMGKLIPTLLLLLMPWVGTAAGKASSARDVSEIISMKSSLDKSAILVKGEISYVYTCPPCPEGMECKPCGGDFICLKSLTGADQLIVNCSSEDTICFTLKPGQMVAMDIVYEANSQAGAMSGWNGRFVFKSLASAAMNKSRTSPAAPKKKVKALPH